MLRELKIILIHISIFIPSNVLVVSLDVVNKKVIGLLRELFTEEIK